MDQNLGLLLHHAVSYGSLFDRFNDPSVELSSHFWVSQSGTIEQYVDSDVVAWHAMQMNSRYNGVETEGCVSPPHDEPMTNAMRNSLAVLYAEGMARHGWKPLLANNDGEPGFGYHRMGVATACPCEVRLAERPAILSIASGVGPTPIPQGVSVNMVSTDSITGGCWVADITGAVRAYDGAPFLGGANGFNDQHWPCVGIAPVGTGYVVVLDSGSESPGVDRFRRYRFSR
jgi:hypothetical protein